VSLHLAPAFGRTRAVSLKDQDLNQYIADRRDAGVEDSTINRESAALRRALNLATRSQPPKLMRVPRIPRLKENNVREGFLEHEQLCSIEERAAEAHKTGFCNRVSLRCAVWLVEEAAVASDRFTRPGDPSLWSTNKER
jgi:hypothetical protein